MPRTALSIRPSGARIGAWSRSRQPVLLEPVAEALRIPRCLHRSDNACSKPYPAVRSRGLRSTPRSSCFRARGFLAVGGTEHFVLDAKQILNLLAQRHLLRFELVQSLLQAGQVAGQFLEIFHAPLEQDLVLLELVGDGCEGDL